MKILSIFLGLFGNTGNVLYLRHGKEKKEVARPTGNVGKRP